MENQTMKPELDAYHTKVQKMREDIADIEVAIQKKKKELEEYEGEMRVFFTQGIREGLTTGNPLLDEIICLAGPNKEYIDQIHAFDEKLRKASGVLIQVNYHSDKVGFIFGIPTGERLTIKTNHMGALLRIKMPFEKCLIWGFNSADPHLESEQLIVESKPFCSLSTGQLLRQGILGRLNTEERQVGIFFENQCTFDYVQKMIKFAREQIKTLEGPSSLV